LRRRHHVLHAPAVAGAHVHVFDEAQHVAVLAREGRERQHLVLVHAALHDAVELDAFEARRARGRRGPRARRRAAAAAGHRGEAFGIQRIQAHGEPMQARLAQRGWRAAPTSFRWW
jgi:hypothetical protein